MPIDVVRLPDEPIVLVTFAEPLEFRDEIAPMLKRIVELRDTITEPLSRYCIVFDISRYNMTFSDVVFGLGELRSVRDLRRPDMPAHLMVVGAGAVIEMAAKAFAQAQYGAYQSRLFVSLEDALAAARATIAQSERAAE